MSEFLKFAYEVLSQVVYNIVTWLAGFLTLFITGWVQYFNIFFIGLIPAFLFYLVYRTSFSRFTPKLLTHHNKKESQYRVPQFL